MTLYEYLRTLREDPPAWLVRFGDGDHFSRKEFFASRVVYYPGSGTDGHVVKVFGSTHSAHCFVYADYWKTQAELEAELAHPTFGFRGYHTLAHLSLHESDLVPRGWTAHIPPGEGPTDSSHTVSPYGFLRVLGRDAGRNDDHGASRLAILFLGADAIASYDALFCQEPSQSVPFAVLLQDHGFGGNYSRFGKGGLLEQIARRCDVVPRWLMVAEGTDAWPGFERVLDVDGDAGGMHGHFRFLYRRAKE